MEGGTDGRTNRQTRTAGYAFISHIYKRKKVAKLAILSFDLSYMKISHLEDLEVNRRVIRKCTLKE
jgi:hypothetical protein